MSFERSLAYKALHPYFQYRLRLDEPLAAHSSFGVGGPADLWLTLETRHELNDLITLCAHERWPLLVVGAGTNILYADSGVRGIVASLALQDYVIEEQADRSAIVVAEAGLRWSHLLEVLVPSGWGGLEFGAGIPGTLGAGIVSNAGAHNQALGQALEWIEVLDARNCNHEVQESVLFPVMAHYRYTREELNLGYRHSRFREHRLAHIDPRGHLVFPERGLIEPAELVVALGLRVHKQNPAALMAEVEQLRQKRRYIDPAQTHLGTIFKDPQDLTEAAGKTARELIEQAGGAGITRGNAQISPHNANYIVNLGGATAADILALIIEAHQQVLSTCGIHLALNVELLGMW